MGMELNICLVGARYRCIINNKYSVVVTVSDHVDEHRYDTVEFWPFRKDGEEVKKLPDLDETKVKNRILKLIKSIETPLIHNKGEGVKK
jgi:hypothetical protein